MGTWEQDRYFDEVRRAMRRRSRLHSAVAALALTAIAGGGYVVAEHQHGAGGVIVECVPGYHQHGDMCVKQPGSP